MLFHALAAHCPSRRSGGVAPEATPRFLLPNLQTFTASATTPPGGVAPEATPHFLLPQTSGVHGRRNNAAQGVLPQRQHPASSYPICRRSPQAQQRLPGVLPQRQHPTTSTTTTATSTTTMTRRRPRRRANPQRTHSKPTANPQQCVWRIYEHLSIQIDLFEVAQFLSHFSRRDRRGIIHFQPICYDLFKIGFQLQ